ncbi:putative sugar transferase EpsL [Rosistilla carotiformis]|uniref:Putative sugar transferase EpsL n=1 Tax=Rosistilla carotiformis TaxID=2528017 RepID=A0A518JW55_9BACT|nr:sugar transferase [Rosistilla carotiformis]QDV69778.1 putative sugar transferase EpsL [Rosistilla carotiformis]
MTRTLMPNLLGGYRASKALTPLLLSERQLSRELNRERLRSDRREIPFCLIDVVLAPENRRRGDFVKLARLLHRRLRTTDTVGHRGRITVGIVLTDTPQQGGQIVVDDLHHILASAGLKCELELFVYDPVAWQQEHLFDRPDDHDSPSQHLGPPPPMSGRRRGVAKRLVDVVGSGVGLTLAAIPITLACVAIRCTSKGPAIFRQVREGADGKPFTIYKLRTMRIDAEQEQAGLRPLSERDGPAFKIKNDPRITPVGKLLRATCIDELPQLVNVFLGQMSLVGPRPLPWAESRAVASWQRRRLDVKPGITGIWQTAKHEAIAFDDWMRMDLRYVDHGSTWLDMKLIAKTAMVPVKARGNH